MMKKWDDEKSKKELENEIGQLFIESLEKLCSMFPDLNQEKEKIDCRYEAGIEIGFSGPHEGKLYLLLYGNILSDLASGMLSNEKCSETEKTDALGEFANILCGNVLPFIGGAKALFRIDAPKPVTIEKLKSVISLNRVLRTEIPMENGRCEIWLSFDAKKAKILIVDDSAAMRRMLKQQLASLEYEIVGEAENAEEAFRKYKELKPDLVTMDIIMPLVFGIEAVKMIMKHDPKAKIVVVSALNQDKIKEELLSCGVKSYISKPFKEEELKQVINQAMKEGQKN